MLPYVNIHTHRPTGSGIELRTEGIHPWNADMQDIATLGERLGEAQAIGETGLDFVRGADRAAQLEALRARYVWNLSSAVSVLTINSRAKVQIFSRNSLCINHYFLNLLKI